MQTDLDKASSVIQEFSRFANQYDTYNTIQSKVATQLIKKVPKRSYTRVLDIGCGSGKVFKNLKLQGIEAKTYVALDLSEKMLDIHPSDNNITKVCASFNDLEFKSYLPQKSYDLILSSSALQWSSTLTNTVKEISTISNYFYGAIFTSNTFKTLHQSANLQSPIYTTKDMINIFNLHYKNVQYDIKQYKLEFSSIREMFKYIKHSGVSGGEKKLSYIEIKKLMNTYPLTYLEFEVLFVTAKN